MRLMKAGLLLYFAWILLLSGSGCSEDGIQEVEDVEYTRYLAYKEIFKNYKRLPLDSTKTALETYLKKYTTDSRGYTFYARVLYELNMFDSSLAAYRQALIYDSVFTRAYAGLGAVYTLLHQNDSAAYYLGKAITLNDSSPYTFLNLSMLYMNKGEQEESFAYADSAFAKADSMPAIDAGLCLVYHLQNQKAKSKTLFERAVALGLRDTAMFKRVLRGEIKIEDYYRQNRY